MLPRNQTFDENILLLLQAAFCVVDGDPPADPMTAARSKTSSSSSRSANVAQVDLREPPNRASNSNGSTEETQQSKVKILCLNLASLKL